LILSNKETTPAMAKGLLRVLFLLSLTTKSRKINRQLKLWIKNKPRNGGLLKHCAF
jgi:hypothetical protein